LTRLLKSSHATSHTLSRQRLLLLSLSSLNSLSTPLADGGLLLTYLLWGKWLWLLKPPARNSQRLQLLSTLTDNVTLIAKQVNRLLSVPLCLQEILKVQVRFNERDLTTGERGGVGNEAEVPKQIAFVEGPECSVVKQRQTLFTTRHVELVDLGSTQRPRYG
jgi:hypothetical protein